MDAAVDYSHNTEFEPKELLALFDTAGFNRLGEWNLTNVEAIFDNTDHYVLAKSEGALVGFIRLLTDWHTRGYVSNLCVLPEFQRRGIGERLMQEMLALCDEKRILVLNVFDTSGNPDFYSRFGFASDVAATGLIRIRPGARST
jgi:ribosomal protein S18 acetylase RimI-like enzyme